ncbi:MAG: hypothetical protein HY695_21290 [Deltaproteobacteria bacterium]|nr:hypothetical protein [Deltaproteobacteria bacterium]
MAGLHLFSFADQLLMVSMRLLAARHELITANLANVDTPGYRPRDINFAGVMKSLGQADNRSTGRIGGPGTPLIAGNFYPPHPALKPAVSEVSTVLEPSFLLQPSRAGYEPEGRLDRNTVELDREIAVLLENSLLHETSVTLLSRKFGALRYAIGEGRR